MTLNRFNFSVDTPAGFKLSCALDTPFSSTPSKLNLSESTISDFLASEEARRQSKNKIGILCHGLLSHKGSRLLLKISKGLLRVHEEIKLSGIIRFDFRGNGDSDGIDSWSFGGYEDELEDLRSIVLFLRKNGCEVPVLLGHSRSATVVLMYACRFQDVPKIISLSGRYSMKDGLHSRFTPDEINLLLHGGETTICDYNGKIRRVTGDCIQRRLMIDLHKEFAAATPHVLCKEGYLETTISQEKTNGCAMNQSFLIVHSIDDHVIPVEDAKKLHSLIKTYANIMLTGEESTRKIISVYIEILHKGGHNFTDESALQKLKEAIIQFLSLNQLEITECNSNLWSKAMVK